MTVELNVWNTPVISDPISKIVAIEWLSPTRKRLIYPLKTNNSKDIIKVKIKGNKRQLHKKLPNCSSSCLGKNLIKEFGSPLSTTSKNIEYAVENSVAFPNSEGFIK